jgi:peroxiredoxin
MMLTLRRLVLCALLALVASAADTTRPSPPFTMQRAAGGPVSLSQYRGKVVAIAFILSSCSHCQELTTELNRISAEYQARGVQILECAFNPDAPTALPEFLQRFAPPFPVGYSTQPAVMAYLNYAPNDPRPVYVPHMVFIDRTGKIRAHYPGESPFFQKAGPNIRAEIDKLLAK